jgi:alpha-L-rhamnosidase
MFGSVGQWLVEDLAGIAPLEPGYALIEFRPEVPSSGLDGAEATIDSVRGVVATAWRRTPGTFALEVIVPPNASGLVYVPALSPADVAEVGQTVVRPAERAEAVELVRSDPEHGRIVYRVGSGRYEFRVAAARP